MPDEESEAVPSVLRYRWLMQPGIRPGDIEPRVRGVIIGACAVTVFVALIGMHALWELVEWAEVSSWGVEDWSPGRSAWLYESGLALGIGVAIALAWVPRFELARLLRVAVLLPLIHLVAIIVAARAWVVLDSDVLAKIDRLDYSYATYQPNVTLPSVAAIAIAFAAMVAIGIAIKRRHGEWKHATVMLALAFLLLLGFWLPILARSSFVTEYDRYYEPLKRIIEPGRFVVLAVAIPAIIATAFVAISVRYPALLARYRVAVRWITISMLVLACMFAVTLREEAWDLYLQSSYLLMTAIVLAVMALLLLTIGSGVGSFVAHRRLRKLVQTTGVVAADEDGDVALVEITSWLRGPRAVMRPFVVTTPQGDVPIAGAHLLTPLPKRSTTLDVGDSAITLRPGDRVVLAGHRTAADGHPFRAADANDIAFVVSQSAERSRFSDVTLVVWRPAVAYLLIVVAIALPYLSLMLAPV